MKFNLIFLFLFFTITVSLGEGLIRSKRSSEWPSGAYCIFQGSSGACPTGFTMKNVRLSVQQNYKEAESMGDGKKAVTTGSFGASNLKSLKFDDAYVLDLNTCCKDN